MVRCMAKTDRRRFEGPVAPKCVYCILHQYGHLMDIFHVLLHNMVCKLGTGSTSIGSFFPPIAY